MIKYFLAFILLLSVSMQTSAQRHGRADAIQNYTRGGPPHPELLLQIRFQGKRLYFRSSDLIKMQRTEVTLPDPATGAAHTYEGVNFETQILGRSSRSGSEIIEVCSGSRQTVTILTADLDPSTERMVVDTVDGKKLTGYVPYYFFAKTRQGGLAPIKNVKQITIKSVL